MSVEYKYISKSVFSGGVQALIASVVGLITPILAAVHVISQGKKKILTILVFIELAI